MEGLQAGDPPQVGPYVLLGRLGAGGMGQVFLGRSPGGRLVAVKVIRPELATDPGFRARFAREVAAARQVSGVFTAPVVDADPAAPLPWLVTGFVNGRSLAETVDKHGALPVASVLALAAGLAEGLSAVHAKGVVHRDLKPSNVLLAADGPLVIDFGISRAVDATHLTRTGMVIGSPAFMSPEQVEGGAVGPASDVFSLGAVLVFAAAGTGPFGTGPPTAMLYRVVHGTPQLDQVPGPVRTLAERCLAKDPGQRPTAGQFLAELTAAHPSAADLTDWLPASILSAVVRPRPAAAGYPPEPAAGCHAPEPAAGGRAPESAAGGHAPEPAAGGRAPEPAAGGPAAEPAAGGRAPEPAAGGPAAEPAAAGPVPEPAAAASADPSLPAVDPAGSLTWPPVAAAPSPPTPDAATAPTLTAAADYHHRPGPAGPDGQPAADAVPPAPGGASAPTLTTTGSQGGPDATPVAAATKAGGPAPPADAAGTAAGNRRRRRRVVSGIAAVAALGTVAGLIIALWPNPPPPPVLRPTGLTSDYSTTGSVAFNWSGPATGPVPDTYQIVQDGQVIGSVPGTTTYYQDTGLAPDTPYQFQVVAIRDGKHSPQSAVLSITTLTPPVSAAVLSGAWTANEKTISTNPPDPQGIRKVGTTWTDPWTFTPDCAAGACNVRLTGTYYGYDFSASLTRAGAIYTGTAGLDSLTYCVRPSNHVHDTLHIQIQVRAADVQGVTWTASSWAGTIADITLHDPDGNCFGDTVKISVVGSSS